MKGTLYMLAGPIGNLDDISLRALKTLSEVDVIYCEDSRISKRLLDRHGIKNKKLKSLNARTEKRKAKELLKELESGKSVLYMSDAGTPGISDPGAFLVSLALKSGAKVIALPGPSALAAAVCVSGVFAERFVFYGFLPHKKGRKTFLRKIAELDMPAVLYESTHRIKKLMNELAEFAPNKKVTVLKELSKVHEERISGSAKDILRVFEEDPQKTKGEFVVLVHK